MTRSETYVVASIAALSLSLAAGCFSDDSAVVGVGSPDGSTQDATSTTGDDDGATAPEADAGNPVPVDATGEPAVDAGADATVARIEAGPDAAVPDAAPEAAPVEAGPIEAGPVEAGPVEAGPVEAGPVDASSVAIDTTDTQIIAVSSGATLFINDNHGVWSYGSATQVAYANLPPYLAGTVGNDTVNTSTPVTFTLSATTTCYLLRQDNWTAVDLTGWAAIAHAPYYFTGYDNNVYGPATIYSQTFAPGVYKWNTYSAMYACAE